jgi:hypothetical protein
MLTFLYTRTASGRCVCGSPSIRRDTSPSAPPPTSQTLNRRWRLYIVLCAAMDVVTGRMIYLITYNIIYLIRHSDWRRDNYWYFNKKNIGIIALRHTIIIIYKLYNFLCAICGGQRLWSFISHHIIRFM